MIELQAIGNIGKDAEQKTIGGKSYASFSIGVTEKTSDGKDKTTWLRVMKYDSEGKLTACLTKGKRFGYVAIPTFLLMSVKIQVKPSRTRLYGLTNSCSVLPEKNRVSKQKDNPGQIISRHRQTMTTVCHSSHENQTS